MNMLFESRNNLESMKGSSELKKWLYVNGQDTVQKFKQLEKNDFSRSLMFSGKFPHLQLEGFQEKKHAF